MGERRLRGTRRIPSTGYCAAQRKYGFTQKNAEELVLEVRGHMGKGGRVESRIYLCPWGNHYHVTSSPKEP